MRSSPAVADATAQLLGAAPLNADTGAARIQQVTPLSAQPQCQVPGARPPQPAGASTLGKLAGRGPTGVLAPGTNAAVEVELPGLTGPVRTTLNFSVAPRQLDENLVGTYTAEVTVENAASLFGAEAEAGHGAVTAGGEVGTRFTYEVTLPEDAQHGPPPNPFNPDTIPPGGSVMMQDAAFANSTLGLAFDYLKAEGSNEVSTGYAMNIERPSGAENPNSIRVTLGPASAVEADASLGVGTDVAGASVDASKSLAQSKMQVLDFDLSSDAGRLAYETFMRTGTIAPELLQAEPGKDAIVQKGTKQSIDYQSQVGVSGQLGQWSAGLELGSSEWSMSTTTLNGKTTNELDWQADNRVILREPSPPNSLSTNELSLTVLMQEVPPQVAHWIGVSMNGDESYNPEGNSDMRLNLNQERIQDLQDHAQDYVEQLRKESGLAADESIALNTGNVLAVKLTEAKTPADIAKIFATTPADQLSDGLLSLAQATTSNDDKTVDGLLPGSDEGDADSPVLQTRELS